MSNSHNNNATENKKTAKTPNKFLAPVVIAGVTIGFLASAYKFVFAKPEPVKTVQATQHIDQKNVEQPSD